MGAGRNISPSPSQGFSDERHGDVVVVRPMRDHTLKEVAFYNRLFAVPSVFTPAIDTKVTFGTGQRLPARLRQPKLCPHQPLASVLATWCHSGVPVSPSILAAYRGYPLHLEDSLVPSRGGGSQERGLPHPGIHPWEGEVPSLGEG